uniref:DDE-1 domain-containing protein n=1 Tax=Amphimedon queenslandica TaxID=400682 RepID=A0A1X7USG5_AMPQE
MNRSWVQSVYRRLGYKRRLGTTSRPPVPRGLYEESRRGFLGHIMHYVKLHSIPPDLILNADQTPSSYVSVGKQTMASCGAKSVPIKGLTDKRSITITFVITLSGNFLPMQIIYSGKTKASLPRSFQFPQGFSLCYNEKHWSNEETTLNLIKTIVKPYVVSKRQELKLAPTQKALMVWDVFRGQMTEAVKTKLRSMSIELVAVPANMTHFFQPLDLTVNGAAKKFTRNEFVTYYSSTVQKELSNGKCIEDIEVDLKLSTIKPLHAQWLINFYNFFTTTEGHAITLNGWKKAGISTLLDGTTTLGPDDPFKAI